MIVAPSMLRNVGRARTCGETTTDRGRRSLGQERPRHGAARAGAPPGEGVRARGAARAGPRARHGEQRGGEDRDRDDGGPEGGQRTCLSDALVARPERPPDPEVQRRPHHPRDERAQREGGLAQPQRARDDGHHDAEPGDEPPTTTAAAPRRASHASSRASRSSLYPKRRATRTSSGRPAWRDTRYRAPHRGPSRRSRPRRWARRPRGRSARGTPSRR